jgi:hypothetical protein
MNINLSKEIIKGGRHHRQGHKHRHGYANSYSPYNNQGVIYQNRQAELSLPLMPYGVYDSSTMFYGYQGLTPYGVYNYPPLMIIPSPLGALTETCGTKTCLKEGAIKITGSGVLLLLYRNTLSDPTEKYYALLVKSSKTSKWSDMGGHVQNNNALNKVEGNALKELKEESKCLFAFNSIGANSFFIDILDEQSIDCIYRCYIIKIQLTDDILKYLKKYFEYNTLQLSHPNYTFNPEYKETSDIAGFLIEKCVKITDPLSYGGGELLHERTQLCLFILNFVDIYNKTVSAFEQYGKLMVDMGNKMIATGVAGLEDGVRPGGIVKTAGEAVPIAITTASDMNNVKTTALIAAVGTAVTAVGVAVQAVRAANVDLVAAVGGANVAIAAAARALPDIQTQLAAIAPKLTTANGLLKTLQDMNIILATIPLAAKLTAIEAALLKAKTHIKSANNYQSVNLNFDHYTNFYTMQL